MESPNKEHYEQVEADAVRRAARDIANYTILWIRKHDPEILKQILGKTIQEITPLLNGRYRIDLRSQGGVSASQYLYELASGISRFSESRFAARKLRTRRRRIAEESKKIAEQKQAERKKTKAKSQGDNANGKSSSGVKKKKVK